MSNNKLLEKIHARMGGKDTEELIAIWKENDRGLWSDLAFDAIQKVLLERGATLPQQEEIKISESLPSRFNISWDIPYVSWTFFTLFLLWVFLIHPFYFFTHFSGPLWPDFFLIFEAFSTVKNIEIFGKLHLTFHYIEFGILSYGLLVGYHLLRKSQKAVALVKVYLLQIFILSICLLLLFNLYPLAELYWEVKSSVIDFEPDWAMWLSTLEGYSIQRPTRWDFLLAMSEVYWVPIFSTIIWYVFFTRSKWIAKSFPQNPSSSSLSSLL